MRAVVVLGWLFVFTAAAQPLRISRPTPSSSGFTFSFPTASNGVYSIHSSTFEVRDLWNTVTNLQGNGGIAQIRDPATGGSMKMYRVFTEASPVRYLTVGHVGPTTARLAIGLDRSRGLTLLYSTNANLAGGSIIGTFVVSAANDYTRAIDLSGLRPDTDYFFNVLIDGTPHYTAPYPGFHTAVPQGTPGVVRFAFGSCFKGTAAGGYGTLAENAARNANRIWQSIYAARPNFFLHLGDTAYCDIRGASDLKTYRLIHRYAMDERLTNMGGYAEFRKHLSFYSTWDDHEIINDWPWSPSILGPWNPLYVQMGKQAFREYPGRGNPDPIVPGELYYSFQVGDVGIFMTDTRSFRSCQQGDDSLADISSDAVMLNFSGALGNATGIAWNGGLGFTPGMVGRTLRLANGQTRIITSRFSPTQVALSTPVSAGPLTFALLGKTILGATQKQHVKDWLLQNNNTLRVKFIASSTPINGLSEHVTAQDSWGAGYQAELNEILDFAVSNQIRNVVFLSGDQHWAGSFNRRRGDVNFFEFMSSPLYSSTFPGYRGTNSVLLSRVNWMFDVTMGRNGGENFGLVTVRTDVSPATVRFELFDATGVLLNSTSLRQSASGLVLAP